MDKNSPMLSRLGRSLIMQVCATRGWKLLVADVKSAFLQADDIREQGIRIFGRPTADMTAKLAGLMGLQRGQLLRMCKPAFGDVRAPLQWYKPANRAMNTALFVKHFLDPCIYMSFRPLRDGETDDFGYEVDGQRLALDGILGLHVDDFVGGGEGVTCEQDLTPEDKSGPPDTFKKRVRALNTRFRFGKLDFGMDQVFCGIEVSQTIDHTRIKLSNEAYVHKVLPISMEKSRRAAPTESLCVYIHIYIYIYNNIIIIILLHGQGALAAARP